MCNDLVCIRVIEFKQHVKIFLRNAFVSVRAIKENGVKIIGAGPPSVDGHINRCDFEMICVCV